MKKSIDVYQISMEKMIYWCDSLRVLRWIKAMSQKFNPFVANRIGEIQSLTQPAQCKYVPCKENSGDLVSQRLSIDQLKNSSQWLCDQKS